MRPNNRLPAGLALGALSVLCYLLVPISVFLSLVFWALLLREGERLPAIAGGLIGFGAAWVLLIGRATLACAMDPTCVQPNITWVWIGIGVFFLACGVLLALIGRARPLDG